MAKSIDESKNNVSDAFECNICLEGVHDPVVTLCGHLYCWPCIYKWIQYQETSSEAFENESAKCAVCKTEISEKDIVPLYGPSNINTNYVTEEKGNCHAGEVVPPRPPTPRYRGGRGATSHGGYRRLAPSPLALPSRDEMVMERLLVQSPMIGMIGEMVSGRILGDLGSPLFGTPNSYNVVTGRTRRERQRTVETDRSLSRMLSFFTCCMIFCLIMFS
ncbi:hypothetical protein QVD17_32981 [Tagetes erecta]|uniref:E3 ubiquitin-protein ligase RMA n=1 Tax=Tagetes erecta TaxID=13708 RepID=A0AAD8NDQ8_TARER|nr:hypothetical protein QVD17_32981 [Tagetes erecta]